MVFHRAYLQTSPVGQSLLRAATWAVALTGCLHTLGWLNPQHLYITGAYLIAIVEPFYEFLIFNDLWILQNGKFLDYGSSLVEKLPKTISAFSYNWHLGQ
jgi:hypothetical protein